MHLERRCHCWLCNLVIIGTESLKVSCTIIDKCLFSPLYFWSVRYYFLFCFSFAGPMYKCLVSDKPPVVLFFSYSIRLPPCFCSTNFLRRPMCVSAELACLDHLYWTRLLSRSNDDINLWTIHLEIVNERRLAMFCTYSYYKPLVYIPTKGLFPSSVSVELSLWCIQ